MVKRKSGYYVVIEGIDGSGKTTQKDILKDKLISLGKHVTDLIEPGGTPLGQALRAIILDPDIDKLPENELDLFTVARRELVHQVLRPSMEKGDIVLCDRNWFSTVAYQGYGGNLSVPMIIQKSQDAMGDYFMPDAVFMLDVPFGVASERIKLAGKKADWFEKRGEQFFAKVQQGYNWLAQEYPVTVLDGTQSQELVHRDILTHLGHMTIV